MMGSMKDLSKYTLCAPMRMDKILTEQEKHSIKVSLDNIGLMQEELTKHTSYMSTADTTSTEIKVKSSPLIDTLLLKNLNEIKEIIEDLGIDISKRLS